MMAGPRLTIGIPTLNRADRLAAAIGSALAQTTPARVIVVDQGGTEAVAAVMDGYRDHPFVRHIRSPDVTSLWGNWARAADSCDTEFFAWLQDDDLVAPHFAKRVISSFDAYPTASVYLARLGISLTSGLANWWQATGPMVPMDLLHGTPSLVRGELLIAGGYFTSFALSPGVAFRVSGETLAAVHRCPSDCDLYNERLVLAELATLGPAICDPAIVGYWVHHEGNESRKQCRDGSGESQQAAAIAHLDRLLSTRTGWQDPLGGWALMAGPDPVRHWLNDTEAASVKSPLLSEARAILAQCQPSAAPVARNGQTETTEARAPRHAERATRKGRQ